MEFLASLSCGCVKHLGRVAAKPFLRRRRSCRRSAGSSCRPRSHAARPRRSCQRFLKGHVLSGMGRCCRSASSSAGPHKPEIGGNHVEMGTHRIRPASDRVRINNHQRHVDGFAESHTAFLAKVMSTAHLAVIRGENDDRVISLASTLPGHPARLRCRPTSRRQLR